MQTGGPVRQIGLLYRPARLGIDFWAPYKVYKSGLWGWHACPQLLVPYTSFQSVEFLMEVWRQMRCGIRDLPSTKKMHSQRRKHGKETPTIWHQGIQCTEIQRAGLFIYLVYLLSVRSSAGNSFPSTWYSESEKSLGDHLVGLETTVHHIMSPQFCTQKSQKHDPLQLLFSVLFRAHCRLWCYLRSFATIDRSLLWKCITNIQNLKKNQSVHFTCRTLRFHLTCWVAIFCWTKKRPEIGKIFILSYFFTWRSFGTPKGKLHRCINHFELL